MLTSPASTKVLPVWKDVLGQKLRGFWKTHDIKAELNKPGYLCQRCFSTFEHFERHRATLLASKELAVAQMPTVPDTTGEFTLQSAVCEATCGRERSGEGVHGELRASQPKRALIEQSGSPAVVVGVH